MTSMIKAELYRLKHSNNMFNKMIASSVFCVLFIVFGSAIERSEGSEAVADMFYISIMIMNIVIGLAIGMHYSNRTSYFEIVCGNSLHSIIVSKFVVYSLFVILTFCFPVYIIFVVTGNVKMVHTFFVLSIFIASRLTIFTVGITMLFKTQKCFLLIFVRLVAESVLDILTEVFKNTGVLKRVLDYSPIVQMQGFNKTFSGKSISIVLISFTVETIVWYMLVYRSYKIGRAHV